MGGLFSTSYDVQKVGQNVKGASKKRTSSSVSHEIKATESGNNVFVKSDIEIIGPINELVVGRKEDAKTVRIDETKTEVFEHVEVREDPPPPPPQISPEERKRQEDLMMAMVRGDIHPRDSVSEDVIVKTIGSITAIEAQTQLENCSTSIDEENLNTPEELPEKSSVIEDQDALREVVQVQVNNVDDELTLAPSTQINLDNSAVTKLDAVANQSTDSQPNLNVAPVGNTTDEDLKCAKEEVVPESECFMTENNVGTDSNVDVNQSGDGYRKDFDAATENKVNVAADIYVNAGEDSENELTKPTEIIVASETKLVDKEVGSPTENKVNVEADLNIKADEIPESALTKDMSVDVEIQNVEENARKLKEKIINFSGTSKTKEYDELYQALVTNILKLDDVSCSSAELDNERRRVIKILQQCMENLKRKIETVRNVDSDSE